MSPATLEKLNINISNLQKDIELLRSFIIGAVRDKEGEYNPEFVKRVLRLSQKEAKLSFRNKKAFLSQVQKA